MDEPTTENPFDVPGEGPIEVPADPAPAKGGGIKAFFGTTIGKILLIGGALAVLGAVIAVAAVAVVGFLGDSDIVQEGINRAVQGGAPTGVTGAAAGTRTVPVTKEATKVPVVVANSEVFTFRDIFDPLAVDTVVSPSETSTSTFAGGEDTLYLLDVVTEDGVRHAVLWWNKVTYTLAAGEVIEGTPWQVISVDADSARMLYGDSTVTLRVGQGSVAAK